jgi:hypothetical protein
VTRQLRIPYLWIDSLCITQLEDNNEDWERELRKMETVFSAAYCTLAATAAADCKTGFLERAVTTELSTMLRANGFVSARTLMISTRMWEMLSSTSEHG